MNKVFYVLFAAGVCLWQYPLLYFAASALRSRIYIRRNLKQVTESISLKKRSPLGQHIEMVISGSEAGKIFPSLESFYLCSVILGLASGFIVAMVTGPAMAVFFGLFMAFVPYFAMMAGLYAKRTARSAEGDVLIRELLGNYKICGFHMKEAVEMTAETLTGAPGAKKVILKLAKGLQKAAGKEEVDRLMKTFRYSIGTVWGSALSSCIFFAYLYGVRVDSALEDLLAAMVKSRKVIEHGRRQNNEARLILCYLAPACYLMTVFGAVRYFGFTPLKFIHFQFGTALGLQWFLIAAMLYIASLLLKGFLSREKMDI